MPVVKVIEVDDTRCEVYVNAEGKAAILIGDRSDWFNAAVITMNEKELKAFISMCRSVLKEMVNG